MLNLLTWPQSKNTENEKTTTMSHSTMLGLWLVVFMQTAKKKIAENHLSPDLSL